MSFQFGYIELSSPLPGERDIDFENWNPPAFKSDLVPLLLKNLSEITSFYAFDHHRGLFVEEVGLGELLQKGIWKVLASKANNKQLQWLFDLSGHAGDTNFIFQIRIGPLLEKIIGLWSCIEPQAPFESFGSIFLTTRDSKRLYSLFRAEFRPDCVFVTTHNDFDFMSIFGSKEQLDLLKKTSP